MAAFGPAENEAILCGFPFEVGGGKREGGVSKTRCTTQKEVPGTSFCFTEVWFSPLFSPHQASVFFFFFAFCVVFILL